jgi:hypothetical protein
MAFCKREEVRIVEECGVIIRRFGSKRWRS